jgi:hypothetical protein
LNKTARSRGLFRKSGRRISVDEIRAEAHKRQNLMRDAARTAEMTEEKVALEKLKDALKTKPARSPGATLTARSLPRWRIFGSFTLEFDVDVDRNGDAGDS